MVGILENEEVEVKDDFKPGAGAKAKKQRVISKNELARIMRRHRDLKNRKTVWNEQWQDIGEFVHTRKQEFQNEFAPGEFLNRDLFDSTGPKAAKTAASSLTAMLWPKTNNKVLFVPPFGLAETEEHKEYYEFVQRQVLAVMDDPDAGFPTSFEEYMLDQMCFGTAGIEAVSDPVTKIKFKAWGVKHMSIAEGRNGMVDTVYIDVKMKIHEIVKEYGLENVSTKVRDAFNGEKFDEEEVIVIAIEPRIMKLNRNKGMPLQSVHFELKNKHPLRNAGFSELPIKVGRFTKIQDEDYGRSPAMDVLPDILEANVIWEAVNVAIEKTLDPPLGIFNGSVLGNGSIDTSAGALNVFNIEGLAGTNQQPIFPINTVGELGPVTQLLEQLGEKISDGFLIDRLLDFNNEQRMTLGEAQIRDRNRNQTLSAVFSRQIAEVVTPLVRRVFNVLLDQGELGVIKGSLEEEIQRDIMDREPMLIPDAIAKRMLKGEDVYNIRYITPAERISRSDEAEAITRVILQAAEAAQLNPDVVDNIDFDFAIRRFGETMGAPSELFFAINKVKKTRDARNSQQETDQTLQDALTMSETARNAGQSGLVGGAQGQIAPPQAA